MKNKENITKANFFKTFLKLRFYEFSNLDYSDLEIIGKNPILYAVLLVFEKFNFQIDLIQIKLHKLISIKNLKYSESYYDNIHIHYFILDEFINCSKIFFNAAIEIDNILQFINELMNQIFNNLEFFSNEENVEYSNLPVPEFSIYRITVYLWNKNIISVLKSELINSLGIVFNEYLKTYYNKNIMNINEANFKVNTNLFSNIFQNRNYNSNNQNLINKNEILKDNDLNKLIKNLQNQQENFFEIFNDNIINNSEYLIKNIFSFLLDLDVTASNVLSINRLDFNVSGIYSEAENEVNKIINNFILEKIKFYLATANENLIYNLFDAFKNNNFLNDNFILRTTHKISEQISKIFCSFYEIKISDELKIFLDYNIKNINDKICTALKDNYYQENNLFESLDKIDSLIFRNLHQKYQNHFNLQNDFNEDYFIKDDLSGNLENQNILNFLKTQSLSLLRILFEYTKSHLKEFHYELIVEKIKCSNFPEECFIINKEHLLNIISEFSLTDFLLNINSNKYFMQIEKILDYLIASQTTNIRNSAYINKKSEKNYDFNILENDNLNLDTYPVLKLLNSFNYSNDFYLARNLGFNFLKVNHLEITKNNENDGSFNENSSFKSNKFIDSDNSNFRFSIGSNSTTSTITYNSRNNNYQIDNFTEDSIIDFLNMEY